MTTEDLSKELRAIIADVHSIAGEMHQLADGDFPVVSLSEAARYLGISVSTAYNHMRHKPPITPTIDPSDRRTKLLTCNQFAELGRRVRKLK